MAHLDILMVMFLQHLQVCGQIGLSADTRVFIHLDVKKRTSTGISWLSLTRHCCPTGTVVDGTLALSVQQHARLSVFTCKLHRDCEIPQDLFALG